MAQALNVATHPLKVLGKIAQYPRDVVAGPLTGAAISAYSGKPVYDNQDLKNAFNPFTTSTFPSTPEMLKRAGLSDSPSLSDMLDKIPDSAAASGKLGALAALAKHIYAPKSDNNPWYRPEKGGALDPTLGSAYDLATNPLNAGPMKELLGLNPKAPLTASQVALNAAKEGGSPADAVLNMTKTPIEAAPPTPDNFLTMSNNFQPSTGVKKLGKALYESMLQPVENQGAKFGKSDIADTLFNAGVKTPLGLSTKASSANNALMSARNALLEEAGKQGAKVSMASAVSPVESEIAQAVATQDPVKGATASQLSPLVDSYKNIETGTPGTPDIVSQVPSSLLDASGNPITHEVVTPGKDPIPGRNVTPMDASGYKTSLYNSLPSTQYNEALKSPYGNTLRAQLARGLKDEVEKSVSQTSGAKAGAAVQDLNSEAGKLLSTPQGQLTAQNNAGRLLNQTLVPTRTDAFIAALKGMGDGGGDAAKAIAIKHLMNALNLGSMPIGYGLRKAAESPLGPMLDMTLRQKLSNQGETP
jgi:hypothetical protein